MDKIHPIEEILLTDIFLDRETQVRVTVNEETVQRYFDAMVDEKARDTFPPITLFRDPKNRLWLADGHHRVMAAKRRKFTSSLAIVRPGTKEDAIWEAVKANSRNGLQLNRADIRRSVIMVLETFPDKSLRTIADNVGCSPGYVHKIKNEVFTGEHLDEQSNETESRVQGKDGKSYSATRKSKPSPATAPTSPPVAKETASSPSTPPPAGDATDAKTGRVEKTPSQSEARKPEETNSDDRRRIEANVKETQIQATIAQLEREIAEWFEVAPQDMFEAFAKRTRKRIDEVID